MKKKLIYSVIALFTLALAVLLIGCPDPGNSNTHTHQWSNLTVKASAEVTTDGKQERTCSCGETETQILHATGTIGLEFKLTWDDTAYDVKSGTAKTGIVHIPAYHNDKQVVGIADNAFEDCTGLTGISIPDTIFGIGHNAFSGCTSLSTVTFSDNVNVVWIGDQVFFNTPWLEDQDDGLIYIGNVLLVYKGIIPATIYNIKSDTVAIAGSAFRDGTSLTNINIPSSVKLIAENAFRNTGITSITLPTGLEYMAGAVFQDCTSLTSITIPAGLDVIEWDTFRGCSNLTTVTFASGSRLERIESAAFKDCIELKTMILPSGITRIGDEAFDNTPWLEDFIENSTQDFVFIGNALLAYNGTSVSVYIPLNTNSISSSVFSGNNNITSVNIPAGVTEIGAEAFMECVNLKTVTFGSNSQLQNINDKMFKGCASLESIEIPANVEWIGGQAFLECKKLTSVTFAPNSKLSGISWQAFRETGITSIALPAGLIDIDDGAFECCENLETVTFAPNSQLEYIKNRVFNECIKLSNITIPANITGIEEGAFSNCINLANVTFETGSQLEYFGYNTFYGCTSLVSITIPSDVTHIYEGAFEDCTYLSNINFSDVNNLIYIGGTTFKETPWKENYISSKPDGMVYLGKVLFAYNGDIPNGIIEAKDFAPNTVSIAGYAFANSGNHKKVTIPEGVTTICDWAFPSSEFTDITIPSTVTYIGGGAFSHCDKLENINIPNSVTYIGIFAFEDCTNIKEITIPASVKFVSEMAFQNWTNLQKINVPFINQDAADEAWRENWWDGIYNPEGNNWRTNSNAIIVYKGQ